MRWRQGRESANIEDRRGRGLPVGRVGLPLGGGGLLLLLLLVFLTGGDPQQLLRLIGSGAPAGTTEPAGPTGPPTDELGKFASAVLADTEDTWNAIFSRTGRDYQEPQLVLFSNAVQSACGLGSAQVGPFYCQLDNKVYLDLSFFQELARRFGAPGDFAAAYVIAHEIGHHVQNQLGVAGRVGRVQRQVPSSEANAMSVRLELQADCFAGVWGHHADRRQIIEPGDFEEGLRAAAAIGDDRLQRMSSGQVQPESWTHGSSEQRTTWLRRGLENGDPNACDTFGTGTP